MQKIILLFFLSLNVVFAQKLNLDSLKKARNYAQIEAADTAGFRLVSTQSGYDLFNIDLEGKKVNSKSYTWVQEIPEWGEYLHAQDADKKSYLLDKNGVPLSMSDADYLDVWHGRKNVFLIRHKGKYELVNEENKTLVSVDTRDIYPLYSVNAFSFKNAAELLTENFKSYPMDSCIVQQNGEFFLYNFKNELLTKLPANKVIFDLIANSMESGENDKNYFVQKDNKMMVITSEFNPLLVEWTIDAQQKVSQEPTLISKKSLEKRHLYKLSDERETENPNKSLFHSLIDENERVILNGEWGNMQEDEEFNDYVILEKILVGVEDTSMNGENKQKSIKNPLLIESCKDTATKKYKIWMHEYSLLRLHDQKEIVKVLAYANRSYYPHISFWSNGKIIVEENGKSGIMDLEGKWLIPPSFNDIDHINENYLKVQNAGHYYLITNDLKQKPIAANTRFTTLKKTDNLLILRTPLEETNEQTGKQIWFQVEVLQDLKTVYKEKNNVWDNDGICLYIPLQYNNLIIKSDNKGKEIGTVILFDNGKTRFFKKEEEERENELQITTNHYLIKENNKWGMVDRNGQQVLDFVYDEILFFDTYYKCTKQQKVEFWDKKGKLLVEIPFNFVNIKNDVAKSYAASNIYHYKTIKDSTGRNEGIYFEKGKAFHYQNGLISLQKKVLYGYIDANGKEIVPLIYDKLLKIRPDVWVGMNDKICEKINPYTGKKETLACERIKLVQTKSELYIIAQKAGLKAFMNENLALTTDFSYKTLEYENRSQGFWKVSNKYNKQGIIKNGEKGDSIIAPLKYDSIEEQYSYGNSIIHLAIDNASKKIDIYTHKYQFIGGNYDAVFGYNDGYIIVQKKGKWGAISYQNQVIIPFEYKNAEDIGHPKKDERYLAIIAENDKNKMLYSPQGKLLYTGQKSDEMTKFRDIYAIENAQNVHILDENGTEKYAYKGRITLPNSFNELYEDCYGHYVVAYFDESKKYNLLDLQARKILPFECDSIFVSGMGVSCTIYKNGKAGIVDSMGKVRFSPENSLYPSIFNLNDKTETAQITLNGIDYYIHFDGSLCFPQGYEYYKMLTKTKCVVSKNGKAGCIDDKGKIILPLEWENVSLVERTNLYSARMGCDYYLLDSAGNQIYPYTFDAIHESILPISVVYVSQNQRDGVIDSTGKMLVPCKYKDINATNDDIFIVSTEETKGIFTWAGEEILRAEYENIEVLRNWWGKDRHHSTFVFEENGLKGIAHQNKKRLPAIYTSVTTKRNNLWNGIYYHLFIVELPNGKKGLIDENLNEVLPPIYDEMKFEDFTVRYDSDETDSFSGVKIQEGGKTRYYYSVEREGLWKWSE